jgi:inhibitor of KinA sporulation pathway (predicted exonuclease)
LYTNYIRDIDTIKNENLDKSSISSHSWENSEEKLRKKRKRNQDKKLDEFTIIIDKSILKEYV